MESTEGVALDHYLYLYCFFKGLPPLSSETGAGGTDRAFALSHQDLCALVSCVPAKEYNEETLDERVKDMTWLAPRVRHHEETIRSVMGAHPVLPVKFGVVYTSDERVLKILRDGYEAFCSFLDFVEDKEEWGVKVYADPGRLRSGTAPTTEPTRRSGRRTPGEAYLLGRREEHLLRQEALRRRDHLADRIYQQVLSRSVEGRRTRLLSRRATGKEQDMLLNAALLVLKSEIALLKEQIEDLAVSHTEDGLSFDISGPWPPYNFCPDFDVFEEERRR